MEMTKPFIMLAILAGQIALAQPSMAAGPKWKRVSESEDGSSKHCVDTSSIKRSGDTVDFTERTEMNGDPDGWKEVVSESRVNCKTLMSLPIRMTITYGGGRSEQFENVDPESWTAIEPDSVGSEVQQFVCSK
ncbi:MAG: surface-adhesin E family protein [Novosphingobium sp.]|uniref:surface-adhesin E family protein n=1 Tax=Novosphingobium sp. TaxID=1874826 RepID=UPI0032B9A63D